MLDDMNVKILIGRENKGHEETTGRGCAQINENGQLFLYYCHSNNPTIGGNIFPPDKNIHKIIYLEITGWEYEKPN